MIRGERTFISKKSRRDWGLDLSSHDKKGGNYKRMNGAVNGKSFFLGCNWKSEGCGMELENMWIGELLHYEGICRQYRSRDTRQHDGGTESGGCVSCF